MPNEDLPPSLFNILREDLKTQRHETNERLDSIASSMVPMAFIIQMQTNQKERDDRQDARLRDLETQLTEARKTKAQQWFAIGSGILLALFAGAIGVVSWVAQQGLSQLLTPGG